MARKPTKGRADLLRDTIRAELEAAGDRAATPTQAEKKNYAERLSRRLAERFANALRSERDEFEDVLPDAHGARHESRARSSRGIKRLDVNYSTPELGLGLGISIKTVNFRDQKSGRYTKNFTRVDAELRAEASDYHERQPWAVMAAVVFLPIDSCDDAVGRSSPSSFGQAVKIFRFRAGRENPGDPAMLFERVFLGLYETDPARFGEVAFFDVTRPPPKASRPRAESLLGFGEVVRGIVEAYTLRNNPVFEWADAPPEILTEPPVEDDGDGGEA